MQHPARPPLRLLRWLILLAALWLSGTAAVTAGESEPFETEAVSARLITAEQGVAPNTGALSAGLSLTLNDDWKTYWRSPGEVGLPPEIDWSGSTNIASAELMYPAPTRFRAFGIENFGYAEEVTFPIRVTLVDPGQPARLNAEAFLLICADVCIPQDLSLVLDLPAGTGIDAGPAAEIATWSDRVPVDGAMLGMRAEAHLDSDGGVLTVQIDGVPDGAAPDIFPEMGAGSGFGPPDIRADPEAGRLWAAFPVLYSDPAAPPLALTVTAGETSATLWQVTMTDAAAPPPFEAAPPGAGWGQRAQMLLVAFLGGLILNLMPCVLPVLSIKFASALKFPDRPRAQIRLGFLASAAGTVAFMWLLALAAVVLQSLGLAVGWGMQFQSPGFLIALILLLGVFSANLFGLFDFSLPQALQSRMSASGGTGYAGDFATGAFAAVMATPCSAPFLGTALAFALTGTALDVALIFTAMGLGLGLPYLAVAARPGLMGYLPRPGRWMVGLKLGLGVLLLGTLVWLVWVLQAVSSPAVALGVLGLVLAMIGGVVWHARGRSALPLALAGAMAVAALALPVALPPAPAVAATALNWTAFDRAAIPRLVSEGQVVFVDVTADWCLTCKANKTLVLDRGNVASRLSDAGVTAMQADWTRPDAAIQRYLEANGRYGIPFNIVYGPSAPEGIALSEVLTEASVLAALDAAR